MVRNRVEVAYARSGLFESRRILIDDWARHLAQTGKAENPEHSRQPRLKTSSGARLGVPTSNDGSSEYTIWMCLCRDP